jgi:formylglycine-generating enzyme required for sulfatase activity
MGRNPSRFQGQEQPVEQVSWDEVQEFLRRLNAREGVTCYRLPTEAEWEYAARAGTTTAYSFGDDIKELAHYAWYGANAQGTTHPVGRLRLNAWDLLDMQGNVWEWVQDWDGPYPPALAANPSGPATGSHRLFRGGGWDSEAGDCRVVRRRSGAPGYRYRNLGFRVLREDV